MSNVKEFAEKYSAFEEIQNCLRFYPEKALKVWEVPCKFSNNLKSSAGHAHWFRGIVLHNNLLGMNEGVKPTFLHEVAHMVQWFVYARMNHTRTFREVMERLLQEPFRCHSMPLRQVSKIKISLDDVEF